MIAWRFKRYESGPGFLGPTKMTQWDTDRHKGAFMRALKLRADQIDFGYRCGLVYPVWVKKIK